MFLNHRWHFDENYNTDQKKYDDNYFLSIGLYLLNNRQFHEQKKQKKPFNMIFFMSAYAGTISIAKRCS